MSDQLDIRSEEVQEILGTPPPRLVRWGLLIALVIFVLMLWLLYWIPYPETVTGTIRIKREEPEVEVITSRSGIVSSIVVGQEDTVEAGQVLVVMKSTADFHDVLYLDDQIVKLDEQNDSILLNLSLPNDLILGRLMDNIYAFEEQQEEVYNLQNGRLSRLSVSDIRAEIREEERQIKDERYRKALLEGELENYRVAFDRKQNLFERGVITDYNDVREAETVKLQYERYVQEAASKIKARQANIRLLQRQMETTETISEETRQAAIDRLRTRFIDLRNAVDDWRRRNLLVSPINGVVILDDVQEQNYLEASERIAVVVPASTSALVGKTVLDLNEAGQVTEGQKVIIDFYSFPAQEYGAVTGIVSHKNKIPTKDDQLPIEVTFPNGLVTKNGHTLAVGQDMAGDMVIVIEEKRLLAWLIERL